MSKADEYVQCPFDETHHILNSRLMFHLTECSQRNEHLGLRKCQYDVRHYVKPCDYDNHIKTCPSKPLPGPKRNDVLQWQNKIGIVPLPSGPLTTAQNVDDENWDDDPEVQSYNPEVNFQDKQLIRSFIGGSKNDKKYFKEQERRRHNQLKYEEEQQLKHEKERLNAVQKKNRDYQMKQAANTLESEPILYSCPKGRSDPGTINASYINEIPDADEPAYNLNESQNAIPKRRSAPTPPKTSWNGKPPNENDVSTESTVTEYDNPDNIVNDGSTWVSNESQGAKPKNRKNASKSKSRPPKAPFTFADAAKNPLKKPSTAPIVNNDISEFTQYQNNSRGAFGPDSIDDITKACGSIQLGDYFVEVVSKRNRRNKKKNQKKVEP